MRDNRGSQNSPCEKIIRTCPEIKLSDEQKQRLEEIARSRQLSHCLVERAEIILLAHGGKNNKRISEELHLQEEQVSTQYGSTKTILYVGSLYVLRHNQIGK